jgi:hypothetical protein
MIFISTYFITVKHKDKEVGNCYYIEDGESVSQKDIEKVDLEIIRELEELYLDYEDEEELT